MDQALTSLAAGHDGYLIGKPLPIENYADVVGGGNRTAAIAAAG